MNTLKNASLLMVMGGVLYFVYITLNKPPTPPGGRVDHQHESLTPPEGLEISHYGPGATAVEHADPSPVPGFTAVPGGRNSQWQGAETAPATEPPPEGSAYSLPVENDVPAASDIVELPRRRRGGWGNNEHTTANDQPPVAPDVVESPDNHAAAPAAPAEPGSSYAVVNPAETKPHVDPAVKVATAEVPASNSNLASFNLKQKFAAASAAVDKGRYHDALEMLTELYQRSDTPAADRAVLVRWLDPLAAKVIYSPEHTLAEPYKVGRGENLLTISRRHQVPFQLLQNVNSIRDPEVVVPNTQIKIIPGPFSADVDLAANEMTLYVKNLYAGRFPFTIGDDPPKPGQYQVRDKSLDRAYFGRDNRNVAARDPSNPYGRHWIDLGSNVSLHGSPTAIGVAGKNHGCLSFSPQDAEDIFSILSVGSPVTIR